MGIPDYQTLMRPILEALEDGREHPLREIKDRLAVQFGLTTQEREQMLASGVAPVFTDRVSWARYYLQRAGMLQQPRRSVYQLTAQGRSLLAAIPGRITAAHLKERSPDFRQWLDASRASSSPQPQDGSALLDQKTPEEALADAHASLKRAVETELLARLRACSPGYFEQVVVKLLVAMGYGGSLEDAGRAIGRSGDEGIDGIINEDRLGLDVVYVQAKRWASTVGRPEIQQFAGALAGKRARKGVFITTSGFSADAKAYVGNIDAKIILINGEELAQHMFEHNVGVEAAKTYEVKKVDEDFFEEA